MWHTSAGDRTLEGAEAALIREAIRVQVISREALQSTLVVRTTTAILRASVPAAQLLRTRRGTRAGEQLCHRFEPP
jgi:hypothetical protein